MECADASTVSTAAALRGLFSVLPSVATFRYNAPLAGACITACPAVSADAS